MLDFVKAMEIAKRACNHMKDGCSKDCPCFDEDDCSCYFWSDNGVRIREWKRAEDRLIEWDKAHPEPQYPTWEECHESTLPDAPEWKAFCPRMIVPVVCGNVEECEVCFNLPIPADIAKKLGIKPKEVTP